MYTDLPQSRYPKTPFERYVSGMQRGGCDEDNGFGIVSSLRALRSKTGQLVPLSKKPLRPVMNNLRVFKSEAEIRCMRKAGQASGRAFTEAMRNQFTGEKDLGAFLDYRFKMQGCDGPAYVPVIARGEVRRVCLRC